MVENLSASNVSAEICFMGALFKNPDAFVNYGNFMRSKYDFSDPAVKFFYDEFETYYLTFSQTVDETKMNVFMSQDAERLKTYKQYKGWKTIQQYMKLADESDIKNYFDLIKKYSLVREYGRNGFPVDKILAHKNFDKLTPNDIYRIIRTKADKIHTVINAGEEAVELTLNNTKALENYLEKPAFGLHFPWVMYDEYFLGMRFGKVFFEGLVSNAGKSRKLMMLAAYTTLIQEESFLFMSNEMTEEDLRSCLITTVLNNKVFQDIHGVRRNKPEKEIVLGVYHDDNGNIIRRKIDDLGNYIESIESYIERVSVTKEFQDLKKVTEWIDNHNNGKLMFKDVCDDYSVERIEFELRKAKMVYNIEYYGFDTLKGYQTDDWSSLKQMATKIKEITNELHMFGMAVFQLTDDTVFTDIFQLSSMNISTSKGIKHVCDMLTLGKKMIKEEYHKYKYIPFEINDQWGSQVEESLDLKKDYLAVKIDKNRAGSKDKIILFEINLDYNTWDNVGYLIKCGR